MLLEAIISEEYRGERIDVVLAKLFPEYSRSQLSSWLKQGFITVDGNILKPKDKILGGEKITLNSEGFHSRDTCHSGAGGNPLPEDIPLNIVYEDDSILIINKPAGLVVHPGAGTSSNTLVNALLFYDANLQSLPRAGIIHRLDKNTTGLLLIAKNLESYTNLVRQMQNREIQREYLALVFGHVVAGNKIETFYGRDSRNRLKMAVTKSGKIAITEYRINKQYHFFTLLNVKLMTGRTHQIRVHMAHINHPIVGDSLYTGRSKIPAKLPEDVKILLHQFKRQALHAYRLQLSHPKTAEILTFTAKLPDDLQILLSTLDANCLN